MFTKFIFEDNENSPISQLLKVCSNGSNIYFSNGNLLLYSKLKEIYNTTDLFIIYIDVSPNNENTVMVYNKLKGKLCSYKNVCILPIICIEYYTCRLLQYLQSFKVGKDKEYLVSNLLKKFNWENLVNNGYNLYLEKLYKLCISSQVRFCERNDNKEGSKIYGLYYKVSCINCKYKNCNLKHRYSLQEKAELLYSFLPLYDSTEIGEQIAQCFNVVSTFGDINYAVSIQYNFYDNLCKEMNCKGINNGNN